MGADLSTNLWSRQRDLNPQPSDYKSRLRGAGPFGPGRQVPVRAQRGRVIVRRRVACRLRSDVVREHSVDMHCSAAARCPLLLRRSLRVTWPVSVPADDDRAQAVRR